MGARAEGTAGREAAEVVTEKGVKEEEGKEGKAEVGRGRAGEGRGARRAAGEVGEEEGGWGREEEGAGWEGMAGKVGGWVVAGMEEGEGWVREEGRRIEGAGIRQRLRTRRGGGRWRGSLLARSRPGVRLPSRCEC